MDLARSLLLVLPLLAVGCFDKEPERDDTGGSETVDTEETDPPDIEDTGPFDADGDGYPAAVDCDDGDAAVNPGAQEVCDESDVDEDCDGVADDDDDSATGQAVASWTDADGDGYGSGASVLVCDLGAGQADNGDDCDAADASANPGIEGSCGPTVVEDGAWDTRFVGSQYASELGRRLAWAGDIDGDGTGEALVSLHRYGIDGNGGCALLFDMGARGEVPIEQATAYLQMSGTRYIDNVAAEDFNGDGAQELLVNDDSTWGSAGWIAMLAGSFEGEIDEASARRLQIYGADDGDRLGTHMVSAGDIDGDGTPDFLVTTDDSLGETYLFGGEARGWGYPATFEKARFAHSAGIMGYRAAAGTGDVDGDGIDDLAIGGTGDAGGGAYLYLGPVTGTLDERAADVTLQAGASDELHEGYLHALGDLDGDGLPDLLVGSPSYDSASHSDAGRVFVVTGVAAGDASLEGTAHAIVEGDQDGMMLGGEASLGSGDLFGDGEVAVVIGSYALTDQVFAYRAPSGGLSPADASVRVDSVEPGQNNFGVSVLVIPDSDADGTQELLVGADLEWTTHEQVHDDHWHRDGGAAGAVFLYLGATLSGL